MLISSRGCPLQEQAISRAHRIGQVREVRVYKLLVKDSIEDSIIKVTIYSPADHPSRTYRIPDARREEGSDWGAIEPMYGSRCGRDEEVAGLGGLLNRDSRISWTELSLNVFCHRLN